MMTALLIIATLITVVLALIAIEFAVTEVNDWNGDCFGLLIDHVIFMKDLQELPSDKVYLFLHNSWYRQLTYDYIKNYWMLVKALKRDGLDRSEIQRYEAMAKGEAA